MRTRRALAKSIVPAIHEPKLTMQWWRRRDRGRKAVGKASDMLAHLAERLIGRRCTIIRRENDWVFDTGGAVTLFVEAPWRIVANGGIGFTSADDGHQFGRTSPIDGEVEAARLLCTRPIRKVVIHDETADLTLWFGPATRLEVINNSSGYEAWQACFTGDSRQRGVIARGGGQIVCAD